MGCGLSELQKGILALAYRNHIEEQRAPARRFVYVKHYTPPKDPGGGWKWTDDDRNKLREFEAGLFAVDVSDMWTGCDELWDAVKAADHIRHCSDWRIATPARLFFGCYWIAVSQLVYSPDLVSWRDASAYVVGVFSDTARADALRDALEAKGYKSGAHWEYPTLVERWRWIEGSDLHNYEVLWHYFGFGQYALKEYRDDRMREPRTPVTGRFDVDAIGRQKYNAAKASVSRAFSRLEARGLASSDWGINLTRKGCETAESLSVKAYREGYEAARSLDT